MNQRTTLALLFLLAVLAAPAASAVCISDIPAKPVPQFTPEAPGVSLWPIDSQTGEFKLKPADTPTGVTRSQLAPLPAVQDSTAYDGTQWPGSATGFELYMDVAVAGSRNQDVVQQEWVVTTYNSGLQVWKLGNDPENPILVANRDGWEGHWLFYQPFWVEISAYTNAVDVLQVGSDLLIGVSSDTGVGFSIWVFNTETATITQVYQDLNSGTADVSMVEDGNGRVYAYVADRMNGIGVYDVTSAAAGAPCIDETGVYSCGVYEGRVGTFPSVALYVSATVVDGTTYVAASDGGTLAGANLEIWQVADPEQPAATPTGNSLRRFEGLGSLVYSPELFQYDDHVYLAVVEKVLGQTPAEVMSVYQVDDCLDGCASLGPAKAEEHIVNSNSSEHLLKMSFSEGIPFLHYGLSPGNILGKGHERLWDLRGLAAGFALNTLPELTDSDEPSTYIQECDGREIDYFADYYDRSDFGLSGFQPRNAVFTGRYLWRANYSVLDVHVRGNLASTDPSIVPRLQSGGTLGPDTFWLDEEITLETDVLNCLAGATDWCWATSVDQADVDYFPVPANANGCDPTFDDVHDLTFLCQAPARCADTMVTVAAWNMAANCAATGVDPDEVTFHLKDPEVDVVSLDTGGTLFPECELVNLSAGAEGRGAVEWQWLVDGEPITGCSDTVAAGADLSGETFACEWDSSGLTFGWIFLDGFEDGTCENWSAGCPTATKAAASVASGSSEGTTEGTVLVELQLSEIAGPVLDTLSQEVTFFPEPGSCEP